MMLKRNRGCSQPCVLTCMQRLPCSRLLLAKVRLLAVAIGVLGVPAAMWLRRQHGWRRYLLGQAPCTYPAIHSANEGRTFPGAAIEPCRRQGCPKGVENPAAEQLQVR